MFSAQVSKSRRKVNNTFTGNWSPLSRQDLEYFRSEEDAAAYQQALAALSNCTPGITGAQAIKEALLSSAPLFSCTTEGTSAEDDQRIDAHLHLLTQAVISVAQFACEGLVSTTTK